MDQDGQEVSERSFKNKIYVAGFFFCTCPGIFPSNRAKLNEVQEKLLADTDVKILQYSIRPNTDTVATLKKYANDNGMISGKWHLATGDRDTIYSWAKSAYFASEDFGDIQKTDDFLHTESFLLIDQNRHVRGIYNGLNSAAVFNFSVIIFSILLFRCNHNDCVVWRTDLVSLHLVIMSLS
jgi:protein SCO1/2